MGCGKNEFFQVAGDGGSGPTPADAEKAADANASVAAKPVIAAMNKFYNQDCPRECPNKKIHRPFIKRYNLFTTYNPLNGSYYSFSFYVFYGSFECN